MHLAPYNLVAAYFLWSQVDGTDTSLVFKMLFDLPHPPPLSLPNTHRQKRMRIEVRISLPQRQLCYSEDCKEGNNTKLGMDIKRGSLHSPLSGNHVLAVKS